MAFVYTPKIVDEYSDNTGILEKHLKEAIEKGLTSEAVRLLNHGANPNINTDDIMIGSVLVHAIANDNVEIYNALILNGAEIDHQSQTQMSAIVMAAAKNNLPLFTFFLNKGQKLSSSDEDKFLFDKSNDYIDMLYCEQEKITGNEPWDEDSLSVELGRNCAIGNTAKVLDILEKHPEMENIRILNMHTPLGLAIQYHHELLIDRLIQFGVDLNRTSGKGNTPALIALDANDENTCKKLILSGANPNLKSYSLDTPLHHSVRHKNTNLTNFLLANNADPNVFEIYNCHSPLTISIINDDLESVKLLLLYGANVKLENFYRKRPSNFITKATNPEIVHLIKVAEAAAL